MTVARQAQGDVEREKKELEDSFQRVSEQAQRKVSRAHGTMGSSWGWGQVVGTGMGPHTPKGTLLVTLGGKQVSAPQGPARCDLSPAHSLRSKPRCWKR